MEQLPFVSSTAKDGLDRIHRWVSGSRRDPSTWLITKGHILKPPYEVSGDISGSVIRAAHYGLLLPGLHILDYCVMNNSYRACASL